MEAKMAFETLSDNRKRAEYDRRLRMGKGGASDWRSDGYGGSGGRTGGSRAQKPESSYSLEDLLRDLNNELSAWDKARRARKAARASSSSNSNKSQKGLLEELTEVGEKFVDFLEDAFGTLGAATQDTAGTGDNSKSSKPRSSLLAFKTGAGSLRSSRIEQLMSRPVILAGETCSPGLRLAKAQW
ncbi:J domain-containing protein, partial [Haematococcus lacustris]